MPNSSDDSGSGRPELLDAAGNPIEPHVVAAPRVQGPDFQDRHYEAPTGPPCPPPTPTARKPELILAYLDDLVENEAVLLEKCQQHCTAIIKRAFEAGAYGMDLMGDGSAVNQMHMVAAATPLAVELYREVIKSLNGPRRQEFEDVVHAATQAGSGKAPE